MDNGAAWTVPVALALVGRVPAGGLPTLPTAPTATEREKEIQKVRRRAVEMWSGRGRACAPGHGGERAVHISTAPHDGNGCGCGQAGVERVQPEAGWERAVHIHGRTPGSELRTDGIGRRWTFGDCRAEPRLQVLARRNRDHPAVGEAFGAVALGP